MNQQSLSTISDIAGAGIAGSNVAGGTTGVELGAMPPAGLTPRRGFGSDNHSGIHPEVLAALTRVNVGHVPSYGTDPYSESVRALFANTFGPCEVFFVFNGTAANVLSLQSMMRPYHAAICADTAHLQVDECAAPERHIGCKLLTVPTEHGKVDVEGIRTHLVRAGDQHHVQPRVLSLTQPTELGTVYSQDELRALADFAHAHGLYVHMDGARLGGAAASLGTTLRAITADIGVDVLSFGGTKNALMMGEAVVFFNRDLAHDFKFLHKQLMQLPSKSRFVAAQFGALLTGELWRKNALHANAMARLLAERVVGIEGVRITHPVQANAVFACIPPALVKPLREQYFFYVWDELTFEVRWMTSFDTAVEDVEGFAALLQQLTTKSS